MGTKAISAIILILVAVLPLCPAEIAEGQQSSSPESDEITKLGSEESGNVVLLILRTSVQFAYSEDKLNSIAEVVQELQQEDELDNVTLVGYQNVYNENGTVKEIRTIELSISQLQRKSAPLQTANDDFETMREVRNRVNTMSLLGLDVELTYTEEDEYGNLDELFYLTNNLMVQKSDGMYSVNKTVHLNSFDEIPAIKEGAVSTSTLVYDDKGQFLKDRSTVVPELFANVESVLEKADAKTIQTTLNSLVNVVLETSDKNDVPEKLKTRLESLYPGKAFTVTTGQPDGSYMYKDFSIYLEYDFRDLEDLLQYSVYGYKI